MSFRLKRSESPADGVRRIAHELAERALAEATATDRDVVARVHNVRKCTKKLRSVLRLARPHLGDQYHVENALIRDSSRRLSASRDAAVVLATFDGLAKKQSDDQRAGSAAIRELLVGSLSDNAGNDSAEEQLAAFADDARELLERIDEWIVHASDFAAVGDGLARSYADGRDAMQAAIGSSDAADWHEWRKRVKDHWYHVRLLRSVWKPVMKAREQELETLSDLLGEDHDLAVLDVSIARLGAPDAEAAACLIELAARRRASLQASAAGLGGRVYAEKPPALHKRLERYWRVWRDGEQRD
jgi:CHAD domain-containing protein